MLQRNVIFFQDLNISGKIFKITFFHNLYGFVVLIDLLVSVLINVCFIEKNVL